MGFGEIAAWMPGMKDPIAEVKEVVYRPSTAADTIRVGDLVCYNSDISADHEEKTSNPSSLGATYAEGAQTYIGRLLIVEKPATANLAAFAGVVAALGPEAGADGDRIQIFIPKDGAAVPVMTDQSVSINSSVLCVANGKYEASVAGIPIGVALETIDRSSTDGLTWMRFDSRLGIWQDNGGSAVAFGATAGTANKINVTFAATSGNCSALQVYGTSSAGAAANGYGLAGYFEADVSATPASHVAGTGIWMNLTGGTPSGIYYTPLQVGLYEDGATLTSCGRISVLTLTHQVADAPQANYFGWLWLEENGAEHADALILSSNLTALPASAFTGDITVGSTGGDYGIKVYLANNPGTQQWYIPLVNRLS